MTVDRPSEGPRNAPGRVNEVRQACKSYPREGGRLRIAARAVPSAHLHLYAKTPRAGRKVGHVTLVGETWEALAAGLAAVEVLAG